MRDSRRCALLNQIRALEFVAVELNLYLDSHPRDQRALRDYNAYTQQLMMLKNEYRKRYGPLTNFGHGQSQYPWSWINDPWPWEID